jgi:tetratricopeptide (TPR) repeat protein
MGTFSQFSVARELLQRGELEQALAEVDRVVGLFGKSVEALELQVEIRGAIVAKNRSPEKEAEIWFNRGTQQGMAGDFTGSIASFERALQIKPDSHDAWSNRGVSLANLGQYESAIASYDQALQIKPDSHEAWYGRGASLDHLGQYEAAIASYDQALQIKPDFHEAWFNRGLALENSSQYEAAIASYDQVLKIKPDDHNAWLERGVALRNLGEYELAIASYDQALKIKPDDHNAWLERGIALCDYLGQHEAAIASFDQVLKIKSDFHEAWYNRSVAAFSGRDKGEPNAYTRKHPELNQRGYPGRVASRTVGLIYCPAITHPLGHGSLQRGIGDAHWDHAPTHSNPRYYRRQALTAYEASLRVLTASDHPEERLQTLQKLIRTHDALREIAPDAMLALLRQGTELRTRILTQARSDEQREKLSRTLPNFNELTVDFHLSQGNNILALETAEADKNGLMQWLLTVPGTANYAEMRETIGVDTAIVYWYLVYPC